LKVLTAVVFLSFMFVHGLVVLIVFNLCFYRL